MKDVDLVTINSDQAQFHLEELIETYLDVHSSDADEFFSEERYRRQLESHLKAPGWAAVCAYQEGKLIGYVYGFRLSEGTAWWDGLVDEAPADFVHETGTKTFAISELLVRKKYQRQGVATLLHNELVENRTEERATLLVRPENSAAQTAYQSWGWQKVNRLHPDWGSITAPTYDVMIRQLSGSNRT
ncbi:MAG: GNAT family N-acetyltransferase [Mycobacteriales bacterium]